MKFNFLTFVIVGFFGVSHSASASTFDFKGILRVAICERGICTQHPQVNIAAPIDFGSCKDSCNAGSRAQLTFGSYTFEGYIHVFKIANTYALSLSLSESNTKTKSVFHVDLGPEGIREVYNLTGNPVKYASSSVNETIFIPMLAVGPVGSL